MPPLFTTSPLVTTPISPSPGKYKAATGYDLCTGWGTPNGTNLINALAPAATAPILTGTATLIAESCLPTNDVIDPGETVTLNFTLTNLSLVSTTNLLATLQASSAVLSPTGPQSFGALTHGGAAVTKPFSFTAGGVCGETISVALQLQDGTANLGSITFNFTLGKLISATTFAQNFDSVAAPALPASWSSSVTGSQVNWATTSVASDTAHNSAFATDVVNPGVAYLYSPVIPVVSSDAQLTFRQNYYFEYGTGHQAAYYYDGGVLDIAIGSGSFNDIISSGGSFVTGGYNGTLYSGSGNPLAGRQGWGGNSGGWITTTITLPAAAAGQNVQLRWDCGTDQGNDSTAVGWNVDTISLLDGYYSCCSDTANLSVTQTVTPAKFVMGQNGTYTIVVTNAGPDAAQDVVVSDTLPSAVTFVSASPGGVDGNGVIVFPVGTLLSGAFSTMTVTVLANASGVITNTAVATTVTPVSDNAGGTAVNVMSVTMPPTIAAVGLAVAPGNGLSISVNSGAGLSYSLAYKNLLTDPSWTILPSTTVTGHRRHDHLARSQCDAGAAFLRCGCQLAGLRRPLERPRADDARPNQKGHDPKRQRHQGDPLRSRFRSQEYETPSCQRHQDRQRIEPDAKWPRHVRLGAAEQDDSTDLPDELHDDPQRNQCGDQRAQIKKS